MPNWALLLVRFTFSAGPVLLVTWLLWKVIGPYALLGFLLLSPLIGIAVAKPLIELSHEGFSWLWSQSLARWEGNYYEFGDVQVRVFDDGSELWFVAKDVVKATGISANSDSLLAVYPSGCKVLEGLTCLNMPALEKLLAAHRGLETGRLLLWAQREVVGPWKKKTSG